MSHAIGIYNGNARIHEYIASLRDRPQTPTTYPMLVRLEMALREAENFESVCLRIGNGDSWYRAWKRALDLREQIAMLKQLA